MSPTSGGIAATPGYLERRSLGEQLALRYSIPELQRGYAWTGDNIDDYVGDLLDHFQASMKSGRATDPYFFGAVITMKKKHGLGAQEYVFEVIDGQQRLTTFLLTLAEIRTRAAAIVTEATAVGDRAAKARAKRLVDDMTSYLYENGVLRLVPGGVDEEFYRETIAGRMPTTPKSEPHPHACLRNAVETIRDDLIGVILLEGLDLKSSAKRLESAANALLNQAYLIHAGSDVEIDAYRLFLVLNDRGLELTEADLLKTRTLDLLRGHTAEVERAKKVWRRILESKPAHQRGFLRAYWSLQTGRRPSSKDLHRQYQDTWFKGRPKSKADAETMAARLDDMADAFERYRQIVDGHWPDEITKQSEWVTDRLHRLVKVLGSEASIPLLIGTTYRAEKKAFPDVVAFLERYVFRYNLSGGHKSSLGTELFAQARLAREEPKWGVAELGASLAPLAFKYAQDAKFVAALDAMRYRGSRTPVRHLLSTLDDYQGWLGRGAKGTPKTSKVTKFVLEEADVDHIYPETPEPGHEQPTLDSVRDKLGNLAFLDKAENRSIKNKPFATKQSRIYKTAAPQLTQELSDTTVWPTWDLAAYERRHKKVIDMCLAVFKVPLTAPKSS